MIEKLLENGYKRLSKKVFQKSLPKKIFKKIHKKFIEKNHIYLLKMASQKKSYKKVLKKTTTI
jgi:hypothetical protein